MGKAVGKVFGIKPPPPPPTDKFDELQRKGEAKSKEPGS